MVYIGYKIINFIERGCIRFFSFFTKIEKKILFMSFAGKQYSDNQRAISEKMHEMFPDYKIVWGINYNVDRGVIPDYVEIVFYRSIAYYRAFASSFCFCTNEDISPNIYKRKGQFFVQTWHGDRGFKKILYQNWVGKKRPIPVIDNKVTDLFVAGSVYGEKRAAKAFLYQGDILKTGMPRNDRLIGKREDTLEIKKRICISERKKILLFAPTFRDASKKKQNASINIRETMEHLQNDGSEWICLIRAHSLSKGIDVEYDGADYIDVTKYPDMADLLQIADMLITDYSSSAGDFILSKKPIILAWFDYEEYNKNVRSFSFDVANSGFLIAKNQEELNKIIDTMNVNDYAQNCEKLMKYFGTYETGKSSECVCIEIDKKYKKYRC